MSNPWIAVGAAGAWALDAEREEAERAAAAAAPPPPASSAAHSSLFAGDSLQIFPTPKEAAAKPTTKKKKRGVAIPLSMFTINTYVGPGDARRDIAADQMLFLPTGPRDRAPGELENAGIGGGFRSYGGGAPRRFNEEVNWASVKKPYGLAMDSGRNAVSSKADEVENWSLGKKSGFGSGFRGMDSDRWGRGDGSVSNNAVRERVKLVLHPPKKDAESLPEACRSRPNPFSAARPREVVLAERGLDWKKMETEIEMKKTVIPTSSQSSRPGSPASQISGQAEKSKPRSKVNPFGDAKPREVLLEEKGKDWRKIERELDHRRIERPERDNEKMLKEEIDDLKKELDKLTEGNANDDSSHNPAEQHDNLLEQIQKREKELDDLIHEFDDKVRFGHKSGARPGSGSSRAPSDDLSVRSGFSERSLRQNEVADRNRSRGMGGSWGRSSRGSGVLESRRMDRPKSRERW